MAKNAFPDGGNVPLAKVYETIGTTNIDMLFFITYGGVTFDKSVQSWYADNDLKQCAAIKNGDTAEMFLSCSYGSTPQLLTAMDDIYESLAKIIAAKA